MRREILIDSAPGEVRAAVFEDALLTEIFIERLGRRGVTGNIYKGRVSNILPGMQSAFVDIGLERDAFLYVEDLGSHARDVEASAGVEAGEALPPAVAEPPALIEDLLKEGQEIVVQVAKDPLAQKGARISAHLSLPGRLLVYLPGVPHIGVSRKIEDPAERDRLKSLVDEVARRLGLPGGFIVRTAAAGEASVEFLSDASYLVGLWDEIRRRGGARDAPALLHAEVGAVAKVLRDVFHADVHQVTIEGEEILGQALEFVRRMQPALVARIRRHDGATPLFEARGVQTQLDRALRPRVWLKSGGSIVINQTEALVAVDVNTGKYVGTRRLEETILKTNLEAAVEIVRQVRLRDLAGIIVIDFIDMEEGASRAEVLRALESELRKDRSRSRMLQISEFGLVEITRQRTTPSLERLLCQPCTTCGGSGRLKSGATLYFEIVREVRRLGPSPGETVTVHVHPEAVVPIEEAAAAVAASPDGAAATPLLVRGDASLAREEFHLALG